MTRIELLEKGLRACFLLRQQHPENQALISIGEQLEYLSTLEQGVHQDRSRLKDIIIGALAAREIESLDIEIAETFFQVASEVTRM